MNGRIYDSLLGRFLSADALVPGAKDLQAYNRYTYVLNNPLRFVDPDGNEPKDVVAGGIEGPAHAIIEIGSGPSATQANIRDGQMMYSALARLFGFEKQANYADSIITENAQIQQSIEAKAETMKTAVSDWASAVTGSADVNNTQRTITRNITNIATKLFLSLGGAKLTDRLNQVSINNGSGDQGRLSPKQPVGNPRGERHQQEEQQHQAKLHDSRRVKAGGASGATSLERRGTQPETTASLQEQATNAEAAGFPHGVSVTSRKTNEQRGIDPGQVSSATRDELQSGGLNVLYTPGNDKDHHTVELPKPVTDEDADKFNKLLGRQK